MEGKIGADIGTYMYGRGVSCEYGAQALEGRGE